MTFRLWASTNALVMSSLFFISWTLVQYLPSTFRIIYKWFWCKICQILQEQCQKCLRRWPFLFFLATSDADVICDVDVIHDVSKHVGTDNDSDLIRISARKLKFLP